MFIGYAMAMLGLCWETLNDTQAASKMMNVSAFGTSGLWKVMNVSAFCTPGLCRSMDVPAFRTSGLWNVMSVSTFSTSDHWESLIAVPRGRGAVGCSGNALGVHWLCCGYAGAMLGNVTMGSFFANLIFV